MVNDLPTAVFTDAGASDIDDAYATAGARATNAATANDVIFDEVVI